MKHKIVLQDYLPSIIATRSALANLQESIKLEENKEYVFDFTNITFVSRSFADEFLKYIESSNIHFKFIHINKNITSIFHAIKGASQNKQSNYDVVAITRFSNVSDLTKFLSTI